jgi:hypothetical protein
MLKKPNHKLKELIERLSGKWQVKGPEIDGKAEYRPMNESSLLVQDVDFVYKDTRIKIIQHVSYDQATGSLQAHYMDTMGAVSTYTWELDGQKMRVYHGDVDSDEYFEATFNADNTEYTGIWHYPDVRNVDAAAEQIEYKRID